MARPTVMTPEVIAKLEEAFAWGCTDIEACLWANIAEKTLYLYQEKNPEFIQRKESLKETPALNSRATVARAVKRDPKLAIDYLARKKKDEFSLRSEFTGAEGRELIPLDDTRVLKTLLETARIVNASSNDTAPSEKK